MDAKDTDLPATQILVKHGRITLIWPLTLHMKHPPQQGSIVEATAMGFAADLERKFHSAARNGRAERSWTPVADPLEHIARPQRSEQESDDAFRQRLGNWENEAYAEAVYFHEFIQAFLYRRPGPDEQPLFKLFRRTDICRACVEFGQVNHKTVDVERVNLYIFRTGVAIFTMDMVIPMTDAANATSGWTLAEFQTFHDLVRRAYAPFFIMDGTCRSNGSLVLDKIQWLDKNGALLSEPDGEEWSFDLGDELDEAPRYVGNQNNKPSRYPPLFRHWRVLLASDLPLADNSRHVKPHSVTAETVEEARWHHVVDERMATLATVSVTDANGGKSRYERIGDGDMVRLCFADASGSAPFPYDQDFLKDFETRFTYDRFRSWGTRFLTSGYSFVALIGDKDADNFVSIHMRRHYFQMMLLAQMEMASLLGFSGQVSRAVQRYGSGQQNRAKLERCMSAIQEEFLQFVHRFRFTGVSNQMQAQELFDLLRRNLRVRDLFDDVQDEIAVANDFLRAEASERATKSAEWLSQLGAVAVIIGIILGLMSVNFVADAEVWRKYLSGGAFAETWKTLWPDLVVASAVSSAVGLISLVLFPALKGSFASSTGKLFVRLSIFFAAFGLSALCFLLA